MNFIVRFIIRIIANTAGILIAVNFVPGVIFKGDWLNLAIVGLILAIANSIIKPILKFITGPLIVLTFGLFLLIINIAILWLVDWFVPELTIIGILAYFWTTLIIAILNAITHVAKKKS